MEINQLIQNTTKDQDLNIALKKMYKKMTDANVNRTSMKIVLNMINDIVDSAVKHSTVSNPKISNSAWTNLQTELNRTVPMMV